MPAAAPAFAVLPTRRLRPVPAPKRPTLVLPRRETREERDAALEVTYERLTITASGAELATLEILRATLKVRR